MFINSGNLANTTDSDRTQGQVALGYLGWRAVMDALEGDRTHREAAFDALQRWAPQAWLDELDEPAINPRTTP